MPFIIIRVNIDFNIVTMIFCNEIISYINTPIISCSFHNGIFDLILRRFESHNLYTLSKLYLLDTFLGILSIAYFLFKLNYQLNRDTPIYAGCVCQEKR